MSSSTIKPPRVRRSARLAGDVPFSYARRMERLAATLAPGLRAVAFLRLLAGEGLQARIDSGTLTPEEQRLAIELVAMGETVPTRRRPDLVLYANKG